jgi:CHAD domain-containing protein
MHDLQTTLGSLHDTDMLLEALQQWGKKRAKKKQLALQPLYEMLAERRRGAMEEALRRIQEVHTFWQPREKRLNSPVRAGA